MDRVYIDTPHNFSDIETYVSTDINEIKKLIIMAKKCFFYDACSFRNHMFASDNKPILTYIKRYADVVIITRTVMMELCSSDGKLWKEHINYIRNMHAEGIKILVIYEEDIFDVLRTYCADVTQINKWLSYAVRCAKSKAGKVEMVVGSDMELRRYLFVGEESTDSMLASKMFGKVRDSKSSGDNMGEELMAVCVHWLSRMRDVESYKYVVLTDDKKSIPTYGKVIKNVREYSGCDAIAICTTVKLCYLMYMNSIITEEKQITDVLSNTSMGSSVIVFCSEEFELYPTEKTMCVDEYAKKIFAKGIKVYH